MRKSTWYWRIWWWFGYHGLYQINWWWTKRNNAKITTLLSGIVWLVILSSLLSLIIVFWVYHVDDFVSWIRSFQ